LYLAGRQKLIKKESFGHEKRKEGEKLFHPEGMEAPGSSG